MTSNSYSSEIYYLFIRMPVKSLLKLPKGGEVQIPRRKVKYEKRLTENMKNGQSIVCQTNNACVGRSIVWLLSGFLASSCAGGYRSFVAQLYHFRPRLLNVLLIFRIITLSNYWINYKNITWWPLNQTKIFNDLPWRNYNSSQRELRTNSGNILWVANWWIS